MKAIKLNQLEAVDHLAQTEKPSIHTYTVQQIAEMLGISKRTAYTFCNNATDFRVMKIGKCIRIHKDSFDAWFAS